MRDHRIEIPVIVQKLVATLDTERADDHVDRFPHRDAARSEHAIIAGRPLRDVRVEHCRDRKATQVFREPRGMRFIPGALKNLQQDQVPDQDLTTSLSIEFT